MEISTFEKAKVTCPFCGNKFEAALWTVINLEEHPELEEKIMQGVIHRVTCNSCKRSGTMDVPLLIYRPHQNPELIFSPANESTQEINNQELNALLSVLSRHISPSDLEELINNIFVVPQSNLSIFFVDHPHTPEQRLKVLNITPIVAELYNSRTWEEAGEIIKENPVLFSKDADFVFDQLIESYKKEGTGASSPYFHFVNLQNFIRRCNEVGIEQAVFEKNQFVLPVSFNVEDIEQEIARSTHEKDTYKRIWLWEKALERIDRNVQPAKWGQIQGELGVHYAQLSKNRAENYENAILHYEKALEVFSIDFEPAFWASAHYDLALTYKERILGNPIENIETAIFHAQEALRVRTPEKMPYEFVITCNCLGDLYKLRVHGNKDENFEKVISYYEDAYRVCEKGKYPLEYINTLIRLGNAYHERQVGLLSDNLEQAQKYFQEALLAIPQGKYPKEWAKINHNLGVIYGKRRDGKIAENKENAINYFKTVISSLSEKSDKLDWAVAQRNLGTAYLHRIRGNKLENIEEAIHCFNVALAVLDKLEFPTEWALLNGDLAQAYRSRFKGNPNENIDLSIYHFQQALTIFKKEAYPIEWATYTRSLSISYSDVKKEPISENLEKAIELCSSTLEIFKKYEIREHFAEALSNLCYFYSLRVKGDREENIETAIQYAEEALLFFNKTEYPFDWAAITRNLASLYKDRMSGNPEVNLQKSIAYYNQALEVNKPNTNPEDCLDTASLVGHIEFELAHWQDAANAYQTAIDADQVIYQDSVLRSGKEEVIGRSSQIYIKAAYSYAKLGLLEKAMEVLEAGRTRQLRDALEQNRKDLKDLPLKGYSDLYYNLMSATEISELLIKKKNLTSDQNVIRDISVLEKAHQQFQDTIADIQAVEGFEDFMRSMSSTQILETSIQTPIVFINSSPAGGFAILIAHKKVTPIWLDNFTDDAVKMQLLGPRGGANLEGYLGAYLRWRLACANINLSAQERTAQQAAWFAFFDKFMMWLWDTCVSQIEQVLSEKGITEVAIIPGGLLTLVPFHSAYSSPVLKPENRHYAIDAIKYNYAPSVYAIKRAMDGATRPVESIVAVDNPDGSLLFTSEEVSTAVSYFDKKDWLIEDAASLSSVIIKMENANVLHFATHGSANFTEPLEGYLLLANKERLTLRDILDMHLENTRLAVLSACETSIPGVQLPEEVISLPTGFIQAGVPGIIGSLWPVNDASTMMLMVRFYDFWQRDHLKPSEALRRAQIWLRDTTNQEKERYFMSDLPEYNQVRMTEAAARESLHQILFYHPDERTFAHPYYWAGFCYTGI